MKIVSWNVNGYGSLRRSRHWASLLRNDADVICLQEMKYQPEPLEELFTQDGYHIYWHPARRKGYAGVATLTKRPVATSCTVGLGIDEIDREGRVLRLDFPDFSLINVYFPHSHRELLRLPFKLEFCKAFDAYLRQLEERRAPIVVCGDLNIAHKAIDLTNDRQNQGNAGFREEERLFLDQLVARGYVDAFRHLHPHEESYTWWSLIAGVRERNVGWRLDYFLISADLVTAVRDCRHLSDQRGSDHCPVLLELET